jgi:5-methylcytosine-specific restriction endonuclease McrA
MIYVRDGWLCGICGHAIDPDLRWPDPMSVSLDHVVALANGGDHSAANLQAAHLVCNIRKGAR